MHRQGDIPCPERERAGSRKGGRRSRWETAASTFGQLKAAEEEGKAKGA